MLDIREERQCGRNFSFILHFCHYYQGQVSVLLQYSTLELMLWVRNMIYTVKDKKKKLAFKREREKGHSSCILPAVDQQLFETGLMCFCLSPLRVIVSCFCHFWNDNRESLGCFPVQFLDAHVPTEKQTVEERRWTLVADVRRRQKVEPELECWSLTLFITHEVEFVNVL